MTSDGRCDTKIKQRIGIAKKSFRDLMNILTNRMIILNDHKLSNKIVLERVETQKSD